MMKWLLLFLSKDKDFNKDILEEQNLKIPIQETLFTSSTWWALGVTYLYYLMADDFSWLTAIGVGAVCKYLFYNALDNFKRIP